MKGILVKVTYIVRYDEDSVRFRELVIWCTLVHFLIQFGVELG